MPRKKTSDGKDEQLQKLRPDVEKIRRDFESNQLNVYSMSQDTGNSLLFSAFKFVTLQQRTSTRKKLATSQGTSE
jgi:hypothetical protein